MMRLRRWLAFTRQLPRFAMMIAMLASLTACIVGCEAPPGMEHEIPTLPAILAGTRDIELTYTVLDDKGAPVRFSGDLRGLVLQRLGAAQIGADVRDDDGLLHVVVDEAHRQRVGELLLWTGTLSVFAADDTVSLPSPPPHSGLTASTSGGFQGDRNDIVNAAGTWPTLSGTRVLAEPPWVTGVEHWHTRVVDEPVLGEFGEGALVGWGEGPTLRIRATKGSPAEATVLAVRNAPKSVIARSSISFGTPASPDPETIDIPFGSGAPAYARAAGERRLLMTPRLPPLRLTSEQDLPPNRRLALACLVLPIVLSLAWLAFVRRFDRAHPEPMWLVGTTFLLGGLATIPAALLELGLSSLSPWLDPTLVTFGGRPFALPLAVVVFTVVVGLSEEGCKRAAAELAVRRPEFDEPIDGIVYGIVASLGFAAAENIHYFALGRLSAPLVIGRSFMSIPAHMFFGALWGYGLGRRLVVPGARTWPWLLAAAACHGLFDAMLSIENAALFAVALNVVLASVFVALVRSSLRHGVVTKEMLAVRAEDRVLVPVGRPALFWLAAISVHVLAFGIFVLGAYYQLARHRPTMLFVGGSSLLLALLALAALGVSTTMELDVAIDSYGVTFAGAARPWRQIRGAKLTHGHVELACEAGPILIGPGPENVLEAIANEIRNRLAETRAV